MFSSKESLPGAAINRRPKGNSFPTGIGMEIAGTPRAVQTRFMRESPVVVNPLGAVPSPPATGPPKSL